MLHSIDSLKILEGVSSYSDLKEEKVLNSLGVSFGFDGKGKEIFDGHYPKQVHGISIIEASEKHTIKDEQRGSADGIYTKEPGLKIGVQTADCVPILLARKDSKMVMALHAGWRGMTAGIVKAGIQKLRESTPSDIELYASIGPCIAHCHYEIGPDVVEAVSSKTLNLSREQLGFCLTKGLGDRWFLDLPSLGIFALLNAGLESKHISVFHSCTYCHSEKWHSFRRDRHLVQKNWSWIQIPSV